MGLGTRAIGISFIVLAGAGGLSPVTASAAQESVQIVGSGGACSSAFCFQPPIQAAAGGDTVTWTDTTPAPHTVTRCTPANCAGQGPGTGADALGSSGTIAPNGGSYAHIFTGAGTYFYFCSVHGYATMHGQVNVTVPSVTTVQESSVSVTQDSWRGVADAQANGGTYRSSATRNAHATLRFTGAAITLVTRRAPDQGVASVSIDGVGRGALDLYAASAQGFSQSYTGLASSSHTIAVTVTGTRNPSSTATNVSVDAFVVGSMTIQDSAPAVGYDAWAGAVKPAASGGSYRVNSAANATSSLAFTGTQVDWVTATGPGEGIARVSIDGVSMGDVDLFGPAMRWQVVRSYAGLSAGGHTIVVTVLHTKNPSSTASSVVVDAFVVHA